MALSHIVMHLTLCSAAARLKSRADIPVRVAVIDKVNRHVADTTVRVATAGAADGTTEFDIPWGMYLVQASAHAGRASCMNSQFFTVLPDHNRELTMHLHDRVTPTPVPVIINGALPAEFSYAEPTIVVFGKDTKCDGQVGTPLAAEIDQQDDDQAYYASVYPTAALVQNEPITIALRLKDSSGGYHYLRMPHDFLDFGSRRPSQDQLDIRDDLIDFIAGKPEDTLLCMRGYETKTEVH